MMRLKIQYISHNEIDKQKWDQTIKTSFNGQLQASSWYLDIVCENWDALIEGDYQRIMPLPWKKRYGQHFMYRPNYCTALGIYSIDKLDSSIIEQFLHAIPRKFKYIDVLLNKFNKVNAIGFNLSDELTNEVDLICEYPRLFEGFTQKTQDILTDVAQDQLTIRRKIPTAEFIEFYIANQTFVDAEIRQATINQLNTLLTALSKYGVGETIAINDPQNKLIAAAFFILHQNKSQLLLLCSERISASYLIIDEFIRSYTMKNITLEFPRPKSHEETELFEAFCAIHTRSIAVTKNRIPFLFRPFLSVK